MLLASLCKLPAINPVSVYEEMVHKGCFAAAREHILTAATDQLPSSESIAALLEVFVALHESRLEVKLHQRVPHARLIFRFRIQSPLRRLK